MISREDYYRLILKDTVKNYVQTLLRTTEYSEKFLSRSDTASIDEEAERISGELIESFISILSNRGYLAEDKKLDEKEFEQIFMEILQQFLKRTDQ